MVCDTEITSRGSRFIRALTRLVLPPPEGAAMMNRLPCPSLFDILDLFAHLLDQDLQFNGGLGGALIDGF